MAFSPIRPGTRYRSGWRKTRFHVVGQLPNGRLCVEDPRGRRTQVKPHVVRESLTKAQGRTTLHAMTSLEALRRVIIDEGIIASRVGTYRTDRLIARATDTDQDNARSVTALDRELMAICPSWFRLWGTKKRPSLLGWMERFLMCPARTPEVTLVFSVPSARLQSPGPIKRLLFQPSAAYVANQPIAPLAGIDEVIVHSAAAYAQLTQSGEPMAALNRHGIRVTREDLGEDLHRAASMWGALRTCVLPALYLLSPVFAYLLWDEYTAMAVGIGETLLNGALAAASIPPSVLRAHSIARQRIRAHRTSSAS